MTTVTSEARRLLEQPDVVLLWLGAAVVASLAVHLSNRVMAAGIKLQTGRTSRIVFDVCASLAILLPVIGGILFLLEAFSGRKGWLTAQGCLMTSAVTTIPITTMRRALHGRRERDSGD
jgi:hypothetical protein